MKNLITAFLIIISLSGFGFSENNKNMITIEKYMIEKMKPNDPGGLEYILFRCIGLNNMQRSVAETRNDNLGRELVKILENSYDILVMTAFENYKKVNPKDSFDIFAKHTVNATKPIGELYQKIANDSWIKNGEYFSDPLIASDTDTCGSIIQMMTGG